VKYILWKFMQANRARLGVYPQYVYSPRVCIETMLTDVSYLQFDASNRYDDTTNIRLVFAAVMETILQNALKDSDIL
jgi:guanine nucleotide-binding protein subunit alpha